MDSLNQVLKKILSLNPDLGKGIHEARILELWPKALGEPISKHAEAVQIKGSILFVLVKQPVWRQELHSNKRLVLQKLNSCLRDSLGPPSGRAEWVEDLHFLSGGASGPTSNQPKANRWFRKK